MTRDHRDDTIAAALQAAEAPEVVTAYIAVARTTVGDDPEATGYRIYYHGSLDEQLGLLDYATTRTRRHVPPREEP
jgi:hypothetical protein